MGRYAALRLTPDQLRDRVDAYFDHCEQSADIRQLKSGDVRVRKEWPTMIGLANWLSINKDTLCEYINGNYPIEWIERLPQDNELCSMERDYIINSYSDTLACARARVEQATVLAAANGDIDNRIAQLLMHQWGYASKQEIDGSGSVTIQWQGVDKQDAERFSK